MKSLKEVLTEVSIKSPTRMTQDELLAIFETLKKGKKVELWYDSSIGKGSHWQPYTVGTKSTSKKYNHVKLALIASSGRKDFLYIRKGKLSFALGDMGATLIAMELNNS